ncbi:DNA repair protein RadC [Selenomonadales bacterium OttesenSCG-928-I06]|nr:DNA repair protein RadC [Selenomonadales bacterium OttesenSCG-928-I06]
MTKDLPVSERPREKLITKGADSLSLVDLLAILLRTGTKNKPVRQLAEDIVTKYELEGLGNISPLELNKIDGIGLAKAVTIVAGIELGKRLSTKAPTKKPIIKKPKDIVNLIMPFLRYEPKEHFMAILLSTKKQVLAQVGLFIGNQNSACIDPKEIFKEVLSYNAASIILVHNHPSGDPTPSQEDIEITLNIVKAGQLMHIPINDHIIIGDGTYISFREQGIF